MSLAVARDDARGSPPAPTGSAARAAPPRLARVPALDGLRGLAVVAVLLFHGGYLTGGWLGVDLFFVLSGYLITSLLIVEHRSSGTIHLGAFWGRRARRLLPALLVMVVAVSVYAWIAMAAVDLGAVRSDGLATLFFVANWHDIIQGASYWDQGLAPSMFAHTWSLAVEEQLYVFWPLLLAFVLRGTSRRSARSVARVALIATAVSVAVAIALRLTGASIVRIYLGTDTRAVAVFLGAFVAGWRGQRTFSVAAVRRLEGAGLIAGVVLLVAWVGLDGTSPLTYRGGLLVASVLAAIVVAAAADARSTRLATVLALRPLPFLGLLSYGLYLWHWPVYVVLSPLRTGLDGLALLALRLFATLAISISSWALLEHPIRHSRPAGWWTGRRGAASALGAMVIVSGCLVAATVGATDLSKDFAATGVVRPVDPPPGLPKVLVVGDSVAVSVAGPAVDAPAAYGLEVVVSDILGCQNRAVKQHRDEAGVTQEPALPFTCPQGTAALANAERPDAVLVLYGGGMGELNIGGRTLDICDGPYRDLVRKRFAKVLTDAGATRAPVVVANAARSTNPFRTADAWKRTACSNQAIEEVAASAGAPVIDLDGWVCPGGTCRTSVDGLPLRADGLHFHGPGGAIASQWLFDQVARLTKLDRPLDEAGVDTPEFQAKARACQFYVTVSGIDADKLAELQRSGAERQKLIDAFVAVDAPTVAKLPPALAARLAPIADPMYQQQVAAAVDRLGDADFVPSVDLGMPAEMVDRASRAMEVLKGVC